MKNRFIQVPGVLSRTSSTGTTTYNSCSEISYLTNSGYTGVRPHPLVDHGFSYEIMEMAVRENSFENVTKRSDGSMISWAKWTGPGIARVSPTWSFTGLERSTCYNEALERLNDSARGNLDLSVSAFEAGQTRRMLSYRDRIQSVVETMARKKFRAVTAIADHLLEFNFGVKPLLSDIYGIAQESANVSLNTFDKHTGTASYTNRDVVFRFKDCYNGLTAINRKVEYTVRSKIEARLKSSQGPSYSRFTSLNPASILWELTPFSFVADWFFDVGSWLRNQETAFLYNDLFVGGYQSLLQISEADFGSRNPYRIVQSTTVTEGSKDHNGYYKYRKFSRSLLSSYPAPNRPSFRVDLGSSQLLNAAALLAQKLK